MTYEPPLSENGTLLKDLGKLAPGVLGYAVLHEGRIYIPVIKSAKEGNGDVGRFLDSLSPRCVVANVTSSRLRGMLERRGWRETTEETPDGPCDVWVKGLTA